MELLPRGGIGETDLFAVRFIVSRLVRPFGEFRDIPVALEVRREKAQAEETQRE